MQLLFSVVICGGIYLLALIGDECGPSDAVLRQALQRLAVQLRHDFR